MGSVGVDKQTHACLAYIRQRGYRLAGFIRAGGSSKDAIQMITNGQADVVVVAFGGRDLAADVNAAGGRIEAVHPTPHVVEPPVPPPPPVEHPPAVSAALVEALRARGKTVREIAEFLAETTVEIRRSLRRK